MLWKEAYEGVLGTICPTTVAPDARERHLCAPRTVPGRPILNNTARRLGWRQGPIRRVDGAHFRSSRATRTSWYARLYTCVPRQSAVPLARSLRRGYLSAPATPQLRTGREF